MPERPQRCPRCGFEFGLTVPEAAERLGCSDQTIRNWIKSGRLSAVEEAIPGGFRWWVPIAEVERIAGERGEDVERAAV